jgi:uncharacterized protein YfdQ (DUF2303 family)
MANEAETIAGLAVAAAGAPTILRNDTGREFIVLPEGMHHSSISDPNAVDVILPEHIAQGVDLQTVDSLTDYVNAFKTETSVLFANIQTSTIVAVIDYHGNQKPRPASHRAVLGLPFSVEWQTWNAINKRLMSQLEFARFLEENAADVLAPSGADLLEACRDLQATRKVEFTKAVRTATDNESFSYSDDTKATSGGVDLPTRFLLQMPIYFDGEVVNPAAFLRWKLDDGSLHLGIELSRAEHLRQAVFKRVVKGVVDATGVQAMFGSIGRGS